MPTTLGGAVPSLVSFLDLRGPAQPVPVIDGKPTPEKAETGKALPEDARDPVADPAFLWQPIILAPVQPRPIAFALPETVATVAIVRPVDTPGDTLIASSSPEIASDDIVGENVELSTSPLRGEGQAKSHMSDTAPIPTLSPAGRGIERGTAPAAPISLAPLQPLVTAGQTFAAALGIATTKEYPRADPVEIAGLALNTVTEIPRAITATTKIQQAPLDTSQQGWPRHMIERIETLRDAADTADTRIRLVPDALGAIDVSVRKEGDAIHVHFSAEQAATRTLLQDAQPRLAELADARGLKLGQSAVDQGSGQSPRAATPTPSPVTPRGAGAGAGEDETSDSRIG